MKETRRIYERGRGKADNIAVIGKVTIFVTDISVAKQEVMLTLNPSIVEYRENASMQSVGLEPSFRPCVLTPSHPAEIIVEGTRYKIHPVSFGTALDGRTWDYCDIEVQELV
ncbi:MAG TPA: hypothetical protein VGR14_19995 [Verrucomicrobiae bacterium]|jgi:hypothetical protein|nr:hypothetical protein [Verrucomicrobiae bacterium]